MDKERIRARIEFVAKTEAGLSLAQAREAAFHLTDWLDDMAAFADFLRRPDDVPAVEINARLLKFLAHAPNHLAAAAKLYADLPVSDVFEVGAVRG
jgi:hypothetical protein